MIDKYAFLIISSIILNIYYLVQNNVKKNEDTLESALELDRYYEDEYDIQYQVFINNILYKMGLFFLQLQILEFPAFKFSY